MHEYRRPMQEQVDRAKLMELLKELTEGQLLDVTFRIGIPDSLLASRRATRAEFAESILVACENLKIPLEDLLRVIRDKHIPLQTPPSPFSGPASPQPVAPAFRPPAPVPPWQAPPAPGRSAASAYDVSAHRGRPPITEEYGSHRRRTETVLPAPARAVEAPRTEISEIDLYDRISSLDDETIETLISAMNVNKSYLPNGSKTTRVIEFIRIAKQRTDGLARLQDLVNALPRQTPQW